MSREQEILFAMRKFVGRYTRAGRPYVYDLRRVSGVRDISARERNRLWDQREDKAVKSKIQWPTTWQDHRHLRSFDQPTEFILPEDIDVPPYKARREPADSGVNWIQARQIAEYLGMRSPENVLHSFSAWRFDEYYRYFVPEVDAVAIVEKFRKTKEE